MKAAICFVVNPKIWFVCKAERATELSTAIPAVVIAPNCTEVSSEKPDLKVAIIVGGIFAICVVVRACFCATVNVLIAKIWSRLKPGMLDVVNPKSCVELRDCNCAVVRDITCAELRYDNWFEDSTVKSIVVIALSWALLKLFSEIELKLCIWTVVSAAIWFVVKNGICEVVSAEIWIEVNAENCLLVNKPTTVGSSLLIAEVGIWGTCNVVNACNWAGVSMTRPTTSMLITEISWVVKPKCCDDVIA